MKTILVSLLVLASSPAFAYPDSAHMTCAEAQAYIQQNGSAMLATCDEYATFTSGSCGYGQQAKAGYVRTSDQAWCYVGSYCDNYHQGNGGSYLQDGGSSCN